MTHTHLQIRAEGCRSPRRGRTIQGTMHARTNVRTQLTPTQALAALAIARRVYRTAPAERRAAAARRLDDTRAAARLAVRP